jgi:squalene-hopene/tetraprenyl-beta-curcumene cyclase
MKLLSCIVTSLLLSQALFAQVDKSIPNNPDLPQSHTIDVMINKALAWLESKQDKAGFWDSPEHPAITGLVLTAMERAPSGNHREAESTKRGYDFLLSCVHPDGGIYKKNELLNYNTSICVMALLATDDPKYDAVLRKARQFLVGQQMPVESGKDIVYAGGIGYGDDDPHSDMSNMVMALEALHATERLRGSEQSASTEKDLNWQAAIDFVQRCQNLSSVNKAKWVSDDPKDKGGFVYTPEESSAGERKLPDGRVALRSYGSMTYAGLLSYIYTGLKPDDPRVTAVVDWIGKNYSLDENPAMGRQGLYYYYHTLAKALTTYGLNRVTLADGKEADWKKDLADKLISLQHPEGYWVNDNGRFWEKDPVLVTAYSVLALEMIYHQH